MNITKALVLTALLIISAGIGTANAVNTFEIVGVIEQVSTVSERIVINDTEYVLSEEVRQRTAGTSGDRQYIRSGQLVELSGHETKDGRRIINRIHVLRQQGVVSGGRK